jgi:ATPase subunit of ABC transporter with duplicated ATPase domains
VWILHETRITDYPGSFEEWEAASRERAHAAAVATAEAEALRKVKDRKQTRRPEDDGQRKVNARRSAERAVAEAERVVADWEGRVEALRLELEDPHLYLTAEGSRRAAEVGRELEAARARLDQAIVTWEDAARAAEGIA